MENETDSAIWLVASGYFADIARKQTYVWVNTLKDT